MLFWVMKGEGSVKKPSALHSVMLKLKASQVKKYRTLKNPLNSYPTQLENLEGVRGIEVLSENE